MGKLLNGILPLNLQFFAEGDPEPPAPTTPPSAPGDLNALLAGDKALQSQFDKLMGKALETAKGNWQKEQNMTAEQLAEQKGREADEKLQKREAELTRRELRADALTLLGEKGLPASLIDCVALDSKDGMTASVAAAEKAFRASVDAEVAEKLKGTPPKAGGGDDKSPKTLAGAVGAYFKK